MSHTPLQHLTDAQLHTLRRLLAAALDASPQLADGAALQLVALAEADAARRSRPPALLDDPVAPLPTAPDMLAAALSRAVADVRPQATSTTKWTGVESILARALGLSPAAMYVASVGGLSRNISVRLGQSRRAREATVAAIIWAAADDPTHQAFAAASRACMEIPRLTLLITRDSGVVDLAAIVVPPSLPAPAALTHAYPNAAVVRATPDPTLRQR